MPAARLRPYGFEKGRQHPGIGRAERRNAFEPALSVFRLVDKDMVGGDAVVGRVVHICGPSSGSSRRTIPDPQRTRASWAFSAGSGTRFQVGDGGSPAVRQALVAPATVRSTPSSRGARRTPSPARAPKCGRDARVPRKSPRLRRARAEAAPGAGPVEDHHPDGVRRLASRSPARGRRPDLPARIAVGLRDGLRPRGGTRSSRWSPSPPARGGPPPPPRTIPHSVALCPLNSPKPEIGHRDPAAVWSAGGSGRHRSPDRRVGDRRPGREACPVGVGPKPAPAKAGGAGPYSERIRSGRPART